MFITPKERFTRATRGGALYHILNNRRARLSMQLHVSWETTSRDSDAITATMVSVIAVYKAMGNCENSYTEENINSMSDI